MPQQFTESEGSISHLRIEKLAPRGQTQARSLCGHLRSWIALARLAAKWAKTVIPKQVNCLVRARNLEPVLCGRGLMNAETGNHVRL